MPNIKSAIQRVRTTQTANKHNRELRSALRTALKKFDAVLNNSVDEASALLPEVISTIDKAVSKGILHKNAANRRKAALAKKLEKAKNA